MKKMFFATISTFMLLFLIWFIVFWSKNYENPQFYHLDVQATFNKLNLIQFTGFGGKSLFDLLNDFKNGMEKMNDASIFTSILQTQASPNNVSIFTNITFGVLSFGTNPLYAIAQSFYVLIYLVIFLLNLLYIGLSAIIGIWEFVFNPVFIYVPPVA